MKDLIVNFIGALVFCILGFFYLRKGREGEKSFINNFVPKKGRRIIPESIRNKLENNK